MPVQDKDVAVSGRIELPVELWHDILADVSDPDLVHFQLTSRYTRDVVHSSMQLRYRVVQCYMCTVDGPAFQDVAPETKSALQRDWHAVWRAPELEITKVLIFNVGVHPEPYISGSLYVDPQVTDTAGVNSFDSLRFIRIPSSHRGVPLQKWTLKQLPEIRQLLGQFACDDSQDLLVTIWHANPTEVRLSVRSCSTGEAHPLASHLVIAREEDLPYPYHRGRSNLRIYAGFVGWMYSVGTGSHRVHVWDWQSGKSLLRITRVNGDWDVHGFAFMDERHVIVLVLDKSGQARLLVCYCDIKYTFVPEPVAWRGPSDRMALVGVFELPRKRHRSQWDSLGLESRPCRRPSSATTNARFHWAPHSDIAVVSLGVNVHTHNIVIPLHVLAARISAPAREDPARVPWAAWGMHTHMFTTLWYTLDRNAVCGSRVCVPARALGRRVIYDFAPAPVLARYPAPEPEDPAFAEHLRAVRSNACYLDPSDVDWSSTRAPFHAMLTDFANDGVLMLAEDGVVLPYGQPQTRTPEPNPPEKRLEIYAL